MEEKGWILLGLLLLAGVLAAGAVKTFVLVPRTVSDIPEILEAFYQSRSSIPPIPSPVSYRTVAALLAEDRFDFLSTPNWAFPHSGGTLYLSDKSTLKLSLPMILTAYEDLVSGKVVLTGTPIGSKEIQTLAIVDAPDFAVYDQRTSLDKYLMDELWPRRVIWTAVLQEESSFLSMVEQTLLSAQSAQTGMSAPQMMTLSVPETITDFRLIQGGASRLELSVHLPPEFIGATVDLLSSTNLVEGIWSTVLQTNTTSTGTVFLAGADIPDLICETNVFSGWVDCPACATDPNADCTNQTWVVSTNRVVVGGGVIYYKTSASSQVDSDQDGLGNLDEYNLGTGYLNVDSDGDGLLDGEEVDGGLDPLSANGVPDEFGSPMQSASNGVLVVLPERCWHAQESSLNLETYGAYRAYGD